MLGFMRKYQRAFLIAITAVIIVSFTFFGMMSRGPVQEKPKDTTVTHGIDGSKITLSEIALMRFFLNTDRLTGLSDNQIPNFFNEGIFYHHFIQTDIAKILFDAYFDSFQEEIVLNLKKMQKASFYKHPYDLTLTSHVLWQRIYPNIVQNMELLDKEMTKEEIYQFLSDSYKASSSFPSHMMPRLAAYEEMMRKLPQDPRVRYYDFSLFGCKTLTDWFGKGFVDIVAQYVLNGAQYASAKGYSVTKEEVLSYLYEQANTSLSQLKIEGDRYQFLKAKLGLNDRVLFNVAQKVLLFKKLLQDISTHVFLDPLSLTEIAAESHQKVTGDFFQVPQFLQMNDVSAWASLESYLAITSDQKNEDLILPKNFLSEETIAQSYPELIYQNYIINKAQIHIGDATLSIGEKQLWQWQQEENNFALLQKQFPQIKLQEKTPKKRFLALEELEPKIREKVDAFSRRKMVQDSPQILQEALYNKPKEKQTLSISLTFNGKALEHLSDSKALYQLIAKATDTQDAEEVKSIKEELRCYTQDKEHYYSLEIVQKDPSLHRWTFKEAKELDILDKIAQKYVRKNYSGNDLEELSWELQAKEVFAKRLQNMEKDVLAHANMIASSQDLPIERYRLFATLRTLQEQTIADEWELRKKSMTITTDSNDLWMHRVFFQEDRKIAFHVNEAGIIEGFYAHEKGIDQEYVAQQKKEALQVLQKEAMKKIALDLCKKIEESGAISVHIE